ncbi:MAG: tetratricopeptide repeat protein [Myxococcota bacterium]
MASTPGLVAAMVLVSGVAACGGGAPPPDSPRPAEPAVIVQAESEDFPRREEATQPDEPETIEEQVPPPVSDLEAEQPPPTAEDLTKARELFRKGLEAFQRGQYEDARDAFEAAYHIAPRHQLLYNLAQVEWKLGNKAAACEHLQRWVQHAPQPSRLQSAAPQLKQCGIQ